MSDFREQKVPEHLKNILLNSFPTFTVGEFISSSYDITKKNKIKECVEYLKSKGFTPEDYKRYFKND